MQSSEFRVQSSDKIPLQSGPAQTNVCVGDVRRGVTAGDGEGSVRVQNSEFECANIEQTRAFAAEFARHLHAPVTVALHGDLGMGKSEIARTIIQTLRGENTVVPSPTFTIVQSYDGISHFDLYRVTDASELTEIGLTDAMAHDITLIEWPEIAAAALPADTIHVYITAHGTGRKIRIVGIDTCGNSKINM